MDPLGRFFTPLEWGKFAVVRSGILPRWLAGQSVLDPTAGEGHLLLALVETALDAGHQVDELPWRTLHGIEVDPASHKKSLESFLTRYGVDLSSQLRCGDLFDLSPRPCDLVLGNPPWQTFADLPPPLKEKYRPLFIDYDLAPDPRRLLLGASRIDLAALVVQKTLADFLVPGGEAWFFLPLSLFLNDGAHGPFRRYRVGSVGFAPRVIYDFQKERVFNTVTTRYGLVGFLRDSKPVFPLPFFQKEPQGWARAEAQPAFDPTDPLSVGPPGNAASWANQPKISLGRRSIPRQGVNTGGANAVFFFDRCETVEGDTVLVNGTWKLPRAYVHPLVTSARFRGNPKPVKWVLIPHDLQGAPLDQGALHAEPLLADYLERHREVLVQRRGVLVGARRARGLWWSLQGVGPYCFAPYKIVWEAYGKSRFVPLLLDGRWQVNQSLQAYIPCWDQAEALSLLDQLRHPSVEQYLASLRMENTMNWAQPGKIRKLVSLRD